jgi:hypothetical protein
MRRFLVILFALAVGLPFIGSAPDLGPDEEPAL